MDITIPKEATKVVNALKKLKSVKAIGLYGSIAMGFADKYTEDMDFIVLCDKIPNVKDRERTLKPIIKKWYPAYDVWKFIDVFDIKERKECTVFYRTLDEFENYVKRFKEKNRLEGEVTTFIIYGKSLYDPKGFLKKWKSMTRRYPEWLRRNIVGLLTGVFRFTRSGVIEKELKRKNISYINDRIATIKNMLDEVVFALNKTYSCPKWAFKFYPKLKLLPKDFFKKMNRFNSIEGISLKEKIKIIDHLAYEIYKIAKKEIPDLKIRTKF